MNKPNNILAALFRSPILWGGLATVVFYALIHKGLISGEFVHRYFASHPVEYVATIMFFVAMAALAIKLLDLSAQTAALGKFRFEREPDGRQTVDDCEPLLEYLAQAPLRLQDGYLIRRLREALVYVWRKGDADSLDDELRHLADVDTYRSHDSYSLVRIIIWAIPILGFLGTVIGITLAVAKISPDQIDAVTAGLGVAFDTTALSLSLSIVLMFAMHLTTRIETRLVADVDAKVSAEMVGRFEQFGGDGDGQLALLRRMTDQVVQSSQQLVAGQADLWKSTIDEAHQRWQSLSGEAAEQLQQTFCNSLNSALNNALGGHTSAMAAQQEQLIRQGDMLLKVVEATGQVRQLETALNDNLSALAGSHDFSKTVISLSAAINLLTARLDDGVQSPHRVDLSDEQPRETAA